MRILSTLYTKIFAWFWITLTAGSLLVVLAAVFTGSQPFGRRWMRLTQDMYARSAVDFYESGGAPQLERYLKTLHESSDVEARLLDEKGSDVLGGSAPPDTGGVLQRSIDTGESSFRLGRIWTAASPVTYEQRKFYFVMEVRPLRGQFVQRAVVLPIAWRFVLALSIAGVFCLFLTRHIVAPVRALQAASLRLAAGDLSTRVMPAIAPRDDELADTARAFDQMADRVQHLLQKRQELLANISHELRSPLTRLLVSLELLRRGEPDVLEKMQSDLDRMNAMIGEILLLTRLDLQPSQADSVRIDLAAMLESIAHDAEFEVQDEDKKVLVQSTESCAVRGDANLLRSCIENVVRNAVHHTLAHSVVEVTVKNATDAQGGRQCEVVVRDHGPGVPEESIPFLFDPFYRVSDPRDRREVGTGLGLSISQKIAELHHGTIRAANCREHKGLVVTLSLPSA